MKESLFDRSAVERLLLMAGALRSGLIDALAAADVTGPLTSTEVAAKASADERACRVILEALVAEGLAERVATEAAQAVTEDTASVAAEPSPKTGKSEPSAGSPGDAYRLGIGGLGGTSASRESEPRYVLTEVARQHLVEEGPERERYSLLHQANKLRGWLTLPEVIRTGKPVPPDPAQRDWETMALAMGERDQEVLQEVVERCLAYAGRISTMLDVGGAVGHVARQFARCGVRATLLDRPEVMPFAKRFLGAEAANIALVGGDFTEGLPSGPFDLVYLGNVTHIYGPETNVR
ncbi:MAG: hypothetical protein H5T84_00410, partial [Thermoleophilia bacterium]|nr:hypothetical protein [Thermoleophilia bacterium]